MNFFSVVESLLAQSGFAALTWQQAVMIVVSFVLMYMAIVKKFEPLLLLPISFGMFLTNLPLTGLMEYGAGTQTFSEGVLGMVYNACVSSELFPCIMFLAVGAMTDFGPLLANPISLILGAAAQFGIYIAFIVANLSGLYRPTEAAAIGIIGGADGPTVIFVTGSGGLWTALLNLTAGPWWAGLLGLAGILALLAAAVLVARLLLQRRKRK